jgi:hypothetical protein
MPFTLSHVISIVPIYRYFKKYFSISGLIMGSMAPDFEFFLRITLFGVWGHTFKGIFFFNLPISILLIFIFHIWVRDALITYLPNSISKKYIRYFKFDWLKYFKKNYFKVIVSIFVGILTHFACDNLTHEPNYISPLYFQTLENKLQFLGFELPVYGLLQIISSILGLAWFLWEVLQDIKVSTLFTNFGVKSKFWVCIFLATLTIFCCRYLIGVPDEKPLGQITVVLIGSFVYGLILVSVFYTIPDEVDF